MTRPPLDLEAIRQRVEAARERPHDYIAHSAEDIEALLAEATRLRSGLEHIRSVCQNLGLDGTAAVASFLLEGGSR